MKKHLIFAAKVAVVALLTQKAVNSNATLRRVVS